MANYPHPAKGSKHPAHTHHRSGVRAALQEGRRAEASRRQAEYNALTPGQKLARLGHHDAVRQRARLRAQTKAA